MPKDKVRERKNVEVISGCVSYIYVTPNVGCLPVPDVVSVIVEQDPRGHVSDKHGNAFNPKKSFRKEIPSGRRLRSVTEICLSVLVSECRFTTDRFFFSLLRKIFVLIKSQQSVHKREKGNR